MVRTGLENQREEMFYRFLYFEIHDSFTNSYCANRLRDTNDSLVK